MKKKPVPLPVLLEYVQSWLWYNEKYKLLFSKHHTNNPQEYYLFILDVASGKRMHARYRLTTEALLVEMFNTKYIVTDVPNMRLQYDILLIQLTETGNELNYVNWIGVPIPIEKGLPYTIDYNPPVIKPTPEHKKYRGE